MFIASNDRLKNLRFSKYFDDVTRVWSNLKYQVKQYFYVVADMLFIAVPHFRTKGTFTHLTINKKTEVILMYSNNKATKFYANLFRTHTFHTVRYYSKPHMLYLLVFFVSVFYIYREYELKVWN